MKTRGGWRETAKIEHSGGTSLEVRQLDTTRLSDATLAELMAARFPLTEGAVAMGRASASDEFVDAHAVRPLRKVN